MTRGAFDEPDTDDDPPDSSRLACLRLLLSTWQKLISFQMNCIFVTLLPLRSKELITGMGAPFPR